jgi:hypothetical protein
MLLIMRPLQHSFVLVVLKVCVHWSNCILFSWLFFSRVYSFSETGGAADRVCFLCVSGPPAHLFSHHFCLSLCVLVPRALLGCLLGSLVAALQDMRGCREGVVSLVALCLKLGSFVHPLWMYLGSSLSDLTRLPCFGSYDAKFCLCGPFFWAGVSNFCWGIGKLVFSRTVVRASFRARLFVLVFATMVQSRLQRSYGRALLPGPFRLTQRVISIKEA